MRISPKAATKTLVGLAVALVLVFASPALAQSEEDGGGNVVDQGALEVSGRRHDLRKERRCIGQIPRV